jgi:hypothetical protein
MAVLWLLSGVVLGLALVTVARQFGERRILGVGLVVAAAIYVGFAVAGGATARWIGVEVVGVVLYGALAALGMVGSLGWLAAGWALHPVWDVGLHLLASGSAFSPAWYAIQCVGFDLVVAAYLAMRWRRGG